MVTVVKKKITAYATTSVLLLVSEKIKCVNTTSRWQHWTYNCLQHTIKQQEEKKWLCRQLQQSVKTSLDWKILSDGSSSQKGSRNCILMKQPRPYFQHHLQSSFEAFLVKDILCPVLIKSPV